MKVLAISILLASTIGLQACVVPHDVLFMTKTNVGLDVDSAPPTSEISIARRELVIAPSFEGGQQPPVLATFRGDNAAGKTFFVGGSSTFVGGDAAVYLARKDDTVLPKPICLTRLPKSVQIGNQPGKKEIHWPDATTVVPFIFGTDTSLGVKIGYSGTSVVPETIKIGFNRKEFAKAPIVVRGITEADNAHDQGAENDRQANGKKSPEGVVEKCRTGTFEAAITPFYAGVERGVNAGELNTARDSKVSLLQAFATGQAANLFVQREDVKAILLKRLEPKLITCKFMDSATGTKLTNLVGADQKKYDALNDYLVEKKLATSVTMFINCDLYEADRAAALEEKALMAKLNAASPANASPPESPPPPADPATPVAPDPIPTPGGTR